MFAATAPCHTKDRWYQRTEAAGPTAAALKPHVGAHGRLGESLPWEADISEGRRNPQKRQS